MPLSQGFSVFFVFSRLFDHVSACLLSMFAFFTTNTAQHNNTQHTQTQTHTTTTTTSHHTPHQTHHNTPHTTIQHTPLAPATDRDVRHTVFIRFGQPSTRFLIVLASLLVFFFPCYVKCRLGWPTVSMFRQGHSSRCKVRAASIARRSLYLEKGSERLIEPSRSFPQYSWSSTASSGKASDWRNRQDVFLDLCSNFKWAKSGGNFGAPLVQVITLCGPFMVSRKLAMKDEPNIGLRCCSTCSKIL